MNGTRSGFTLTDLVVAIAVIALLIAILVPVFTRARQKARENTCTSNERQIGLGLLMYTQDYDDRAPFFRDVAQGKSWWTPRMVTWKDLIYPYIKNGGRGYGTTTFFSTPGNGGLYLCPENRAAWSKDKMAAWGGWGTGAAGDETGRYPRSYAVNSDAGLNEWGLKGYNDDPSHPLRFWPCVGDGTCSKNTGVMSKLQSPATEIAVAESKLSLSDTTVGYQISGCLDNGSPMSNTQASCGQSHGGGYENFVFFDGHTKAVRLTDTIKLDYWGRYQYCNQNPPGGACGSTQQQKDLAGANKLPEWNPGF